MVMQIRRTRVPDSPPPAGSLAPGQLGVELPYEPPHLWTGVPSSFDPDQQKLIIPVPGNRVLVRRQTVTTPVSSIIFTDITSDFEWYELAYFDVMFSITSTLFMRVSNNNGTSWLASNYRWSFYGAWEVHTASQAQGARAEDEGQPQTTYILMSGTQEPGLHSTGTINCFGLARPTPPIFMFDFTSYNFFNGNGRFFGQARAGINNVNALQLAVGASLSSGTFLLFGLR